MRDKPERGRELEKKLHKRIRKLNTLALSDVVDDFPNVPPAVYDEYRAGLTEALTEEMMAAAMVTAQEYAEYFDANETEIQLALLAYLAGHIEDVASNATNNTRRVIERAAAMPGAAEWGAGAVEAALSWRLGNSNAETIAATEITQAISWARAHIMDIMIAAGLRPVMVWRTQRDERVCAICAPLDGLTQRDWAARGVTSPPPAHPRCRCRVEIVLP